MGMVGNEARFSRVGLAKIGIRWKMVQKKYTYCSAKIESKRV
jgi:hypothetical protein